MIDLETLGRAIKPLLDRVKLAASRAKVHLIEPQRRTQRLQVTLLAGEVADGLEHFQPYGFTSAPLHGAEALVQFLGGNRSHGIVTVVSDGRSRPRTLTQGEVAIYHASDDPQASAEEARHRITLTAGKLIIRADALDIKCGRSSLKIDDSGIFADALEYE